MSRSTWQMSAIRDKVIIHRWPDVVVAAILLAMPLGYANTRIAGIVGGDVQPAFDFTKVWRPLAEAVLSGAPLYLAGTADNKPPLFLVVDLLTGLFAHHALVFLLLIGVINGIAAVLLWRLLGQYGRRNTGVLAAIFFLLFISDINAHYIQAGSFAVTFMLLALLTDRPAFSGSFIAIAGLFYQYAVLVVPAVLVVQLARTETAPVQWGAYYAGGGLVTVAGVFGAVGLLWSPKSALAGLYWSFGLPTGVTSPPLWPYIHPPGQYTGEMWLLHAPGQWAASVWPIVRTLSPLFLLSGIALVGEEWTGDSASIVTHALGLAGAASLPLVIRTYIDYVILALPFICALAAVGLQQVLQRSYRMYHTL